MSIAHAFAPTPAIRPEVTPEIEEAIIDALNWKQELGESHVDLAARKERALEVLFSALPVLECLAVQRRFEIDAAADALARAFRRFNVERRGRVIRYLADLRRRTVTVR